MSTIDHAVDEIVSAYLEAHNEHDFIKVGELFEENGRHSEAATGSERVGGKEIAEGLVSFLRSFPDAHWDYEAAIIDKSRAAVPYRLTGTLSAQLGPFVPEGQALDLPGVFVIEFADTGITSCRDYWDAATFGRQMRGAIA